jgi:hypothetical protein
MEEPTATVATPTASPEQAASPDSGVQEPRSLLEVLVEPVWRGRKHLGRPRVTTAVLVAVWIGLFVLYLAIHPN